MCVCVCVCVRQSSTTDCVTVFCVWQLPRLLVWQNGFFFSFFFLLKPRLLLWFNAWEHLCQGLNYSHAEAESKIRTETHWPFFFFFFFKRSQKHYMRHLLIQPHTQPQFSLKTSLVFFPCELREACSLSCPGSMLCPPVKMAFPRMRPSTLPSSSDSFWAAPEACYID